MLYLTNSNMKRKVEKSMTDTDKMKNGVSTGKKLSFVASLSDNVPYRQCHKDAIPYRKNFETSKEDQARRLLVDFNKRVFKNALDPNMQIVWTNKLRTTAGTTTFLFTKMTQGDDIRTSRIKLSCKVVDSPQRLRDTLIHELCHAATWVIDNKPRSYHGPVWRKWTKLALKVYPELGEIRTRHKMPIFFKYSYNCTNCSHSIQRHSKSIDVQIKSCGICGCKFRLILNKKNKDGVVVSTPARKGTANKFALFVKENYASTKNGWTHAQVMRILGEQFTKSKKD